MQYTNSQILAAVLNHFAQPLIKDFASLKISQLGGFQMAENMIKKWLPVSPNYSLMNDISFAIQGATDKAIIPILNKYLSKVPDELIPTLAHSIVDEALEKGKLEFMDGKIIFEKEDLTELKKLLDYNLPLEKNSEYTVKTKLEDTAEA